MEYLKGIYKGLWIALQIVKVMGDEDNETIQQRLDEKMADVVLLQAKIVHI